MQEAQLKQLVTQALGAEPLSLQPLPHPFGQSNQVWQATLPDQTVIVRTNADLRAMTGTAANLNALAGLGLPVPRVLAADLSAARYPDAYLLLSAIPGRELRLELPTMTLPQIRTVAGAVVNSQRRVATLAPGSGYGRSIGGSPPPCRTWADFLRAEVEAHLPNLDGYASAELPLQIRRLLTGCEPDLAGVPPTCFLDDLSVKNVLVAEGRLTGFIDFDWLCYGDPLYFVGLIQVAAQAHRIAGGETYWAELCRQWPVTPTDERLVDLYAIGHALVFLGYRRRAKDDRTIERLVELIQSWV